MSAVQHHPNEMPGATGSAVAEYDPLLQCLHVITRLHGRPISSTTLSAGVPMAGEQFGTTEYLRAAQFHGYSAQLVRRRLNRISQLVMPATLLLKDGGACVLTRFVTPKIAEVVLPESGFGAREITLADLKSTYSGYAIFTQEELRLDESRIGEPEIRRNRFWFWGTLAAY